MSEKYFNAYVDAAVGSIHEYVALTLQLKAQLRVANELIAEKDKDSAINSARIEEAERERDNAIKNMEQQLIRLRDEKDTHINQLNAELHDARNIRNQSASALENELNSLRGRLHEIDQWKETARVAEDNLRAMQNKVQHMDTLTKQFNDLKSQLLKVSTEHETAKARIRELEDSTKAPKKVINNKTSSATKATVTKTKETTTDDF